MLYCESYTDSMAAPEVSVRSDAAAVGPAGATTVASPLRPGSASPKLATGAGTPLHLKQQQPLLAAMQKAPSGRFSNLPVPRASPVAGTALPQGPAPSLTQAPTPAPITIATQTPASATPHAVATAVSTPVPAASATAAVTTPATTPAISEAETTTDRGYSSLPVPNSPMPDGLERIASEQPSFSTSELPSFTGHKNITDILDSDSDDGTNDDGAYEDWGHLDGAVHKLRAEEASFVRHAKIVTPPPGPRQQQQQLLHLQPLTGQLSPASPSSPAAHPMLQFDTSPTAGAIAAHNLNSQLSASQHNLLYGAAQAITSPTGSGSSRRVSFAGISVPSRRVSGTGGAAAGLLLSLTQQLEDPQQQAYNLMSVRNASKNFQREVIPSYARHTRASSSGDVDINRTVSGKFVSPLRAAQSRLSIAGHELEHQLSSKIVDRPARSTTSGTRLLDVPTSPKLIPTPLSKLAAGMPPPVPKHPLTRSTTASNPGTQL